MGGALGLGIPGGDSRRDRRGASHFQARFSLGDARCSHLRQHFDLPLLGGVAEAFSAIRRPLPMALFPGRPHLANPARRGTAASARSHPAAAGGKNEPERDVVGGLGRSLTYRPRTGPPPPALRLLPHRRMNLQSPCFPPELTPQKKRRLGFPRTSAFSYVGSCFYAFLDFSIHLSNSMIN